MNRWTRNKIIKETSKKDNKEFLESVITNKGKCLRNCHRTCILFPICDRFYPRETERKIEVRNKIAIMEYIKRYGDAALFELVL